MRAGWLVLVRAIDIGAIEVCQVVAELAQPGPELINPLTSLR